MRRILVVLTALVLILIAVLPLFGFNMILVLWLVALLRFDTSMEPVYLFVGRSAGLAAAAHFAIYFPAQWAPSNICCTFACVYELHNVFRNCLPPTDFLFPADPIVANTNSNWLKR